MSEPRASVLFVCLGNICRSPLAEGVFRREARLAGRRNSFPADSAGTASYHVGKPADPRALAVAAKHGVPMTGVARRIERRDFERFDWIVAMDASNLRALERHRPRGSPAELALMRDYDDERPGADVPDPYYGGPEDFERVYQILERSCRGFLAALVRPARG